MPGIVLLVIGVGSLQAMLDLGHDRGWFGSPLIVTLAVVAALSIVSLLIWGGGRSASVVDLSLFRDRTFSFCVLIISLGMMSFSVVGVVFPLWMQAVMGYNAFHAKPPRRRSACSRWCSRSSSGCMRIASTRACSRPSASSCSRPCSRGMRISR